MSFWSFADLHPFVALAMVVVIAFFTAVVLTVVAGNIHARGKS